MTQAVHGVNRVWLGFSGLAFVICAILLFVRFHRAEPAPAASVAKPSPIVHEKLSVPAGAPASRGGALSPAIGALGTSGAPAATVPAPTVPEPVTPPKSQPTLSDGKKKAGKQGAAHSPRSPGAKPPISRGIPLPDDSELDTGAASPRAPSTPSAPDGYGAGRGLGRPTAPPDRVKPKRHAPPPATKEKPEPQATSPGAAETPPAGRSDKLVEGVLKVNAPSTMLIGESEHIRAVIGTKANSEAVDQEAGTDVGEGPRVQLGREMLLSPLVRMELRPDVPGDFDISSFVSQAEQRLTDNETTVWDWAVQPKREGLRGLTLIVTDLKETSREPIRTKTYPVHIEVRVATIQKVHDVAVSISSVLSGLAGLIGAWMGLLRPILQRRRENEGGMIPPRPPMPGTSPHPPGSTLRPGGHESSHTPPSH